MAGPVLYSTNPWASHDFCDRYRGGRHFVWCSEHYDPTSAAAGSFAAAVAPSSSPKAIYDALKRDCELEEAHSDLIRRYRRTWRRLAAGWREEGTISEIEMKEIIALVSARSWRMWRPTLYVIPRAPIEEAGRLVKVAHANRAGYGPEFKIVDLHSSEFDCIER